MEVRGDGRMVCFEGVRVQATINLDVGDIIAAKEVLSKAGK